MAIEYCPRCGNPRTGAFRFCRHCQFDFDEPNAVIAQPATPPPPAAPPPAASEASHASKGWRPSPLFLVLAAAVVVAGLVAVNMGGLGAPSIGGSTNVPPAGEIWFGESFDTGTFAIRDKTSRVSSNEAFALVASLDSVVDGAEMNVRVYFNDALVATNGFNATGSGDLWGWTAGPLLAAGKWTYELTDIGGNVLARGTIIASE